MFSIQPGWDDARIADAITEHAVGVFAEQQLPDINQYVAVLNPPSAFPKSVEAAMAVGVRGLMRSGASSEEARVTLTGRFPEHARVIDEAVEIESILVTNSRLRSLDAGPPQIQVPCELGPPLATGQARYRLLRIAGSGSFGLVAEGVDLALTSEDRPARVAIKLTRRVEHPQWGGAVEAVKARRIDHPQVVRVIDTGTDAALGVDYAVFNWIPGGTLEDHVQARGCKGAREAAAMVQSASRAVHEVHRAGLIHRDLKPTNIMLGADGEPIVTDVGIAVMNDGATFGDDGDAPFGCWAFMAPEQVDPTLPVSTATDVYALAAILVWLVTGKPIAGETVEEISSFHASRERGNPVVRLPDEFTGDLRRVVHRALRHDPSRRQGSAQEFAQDLEACLERRPVAWTRPSVGKRTGLLVRRNPIRTAMLLVAVCALSIGGWQWFDASIQRAERRAWNERRQEFAVELSQMSDSMQESGVTERVVMFLWMLDRIRGTKLLGEVMDPEVSLSRLSVIAHNAGSIAPPSSFERAFWAMLEARWRTLDSNDEPGGLTALARAAESELSAALHEDDPLLIDARALASCAELKSLYWRAHSEREAAVSDALLADATRVREELLGFRRALVEIAPGGPMHRLVLRSLRNVHHELLLDDKGERANFARELESLERTRPGLNVAEG